MQNSPRSFNSKEVIHLYTPFRALIVHVTIIPISLWVIKYSHNTDNTHRHKPRLWSCCLRSRDAVGRQQRWTAPMGTDAVTSGSPLAAPDLSTQTPCTEPERHFDSCSTLTKRLTKTQEKRGFPQSSPIKSQILFSTFTELHTFTYMLTQYTQRKTYCTCGYKKAGFDWQIFF